MELHPPRRLTRDDLKRIDDIVLHDKDKVNPLMTRDEELCRAWFTKGWQMAELYGIHADLEATLNRAILTAKTLGRESQSLSPTSPPPLDELKLSFELGKKA